MVLMASSPSFQHRKRPKVEEEGEDQISRLPDEILCHILSFLRTKDFVRTSVFSKRWTHIWTSIPIIEIGSHVPADFVDRVLRRNVSYLRKLFLYHSNHQSSRIREWLKAAFMSNIVEIDMFLMMEYPLSVFTNKKLVILKLSDWSEKKTGFLNLPAAVVRLPSLKILHLHSVQFLDDNSMHNLISGCPILEELDIWIGYVNRRTFTIRSNSLRSLKIRSSYSCYFNSIQFKIVIDTKNVKRLDLDYHVKVLYDVNSLPSLEIVNLTGCTSCSRRMRTNVDTNYSRLVELIRKFSSTKHMFLDCEGILGHLESSQLNDLHLHTFHNLTHLKLDSFKDSWKVLPYLFERLPILVTFEIHRVSFCKGRWQQPCRQFHAPECLMLNLEEVKLTGFRACADEMEMVGYFLKNAPTLKKMSIQSSYRGSQKMLEISQQLLTFERRSNKCQIIFN